MRKTQRAYKNDVREFIAYAGLRDYGELRSIVRAHIIDWRRDMERRELEPATIRRKLSALSSLFDYLCERNAVAGNPVDGVKRPMANGNEGSTPALGDRQARKLLDAPPADTLKGVRDRAILATLLYHGIRREELCGLRVKDLHSRQGVLHFRIKGKRAKIRFVPVNAAAQRTIEEYLALAGHRGDLEGPLFRPVKNNRTGRLDRPLDPASVYRNIVRKYGEETGISAEVNGLCVHSLRATAATNALVARSRHRQGSGMARPRQRVDDAPLRPAQEQARRQPVISREILRRIMRKRKPLAQEIPRSYELHQ